MLVHATREYLYIFLRMNDRRILCFLILNDQRNGAFLLGRGKYERD